MRLIIATRNNGKLREIKKIVKGLRLEVVSLRDIGYTTRIKETGKSFFENALKKAHAVSKKYPDDLIAAEDSGLEVPTLGGKPGIYSKRFSGKDATDLKNNRKLLRALSGNSPGERRAHFRCVGVLMKNGKLLRRFEGTLSGNIHHAIAGSGGFGYDPIFYLPAYKKTVAQLPLTKKNTISHRAKAFTQLKKFLAKYLKTH